MTKKKKSKDFKGWTIKYYDYSDFDIGEFESVSFLPQVEIIDPEGVKNENIQFFEILEAEKFIELKETINQSKKNRN